MKVTDMDKKQQIWQAVLEILEVNTTEVSFNTWLKPLILHDIDEELKIVYMGIKIDSGSDFFLNIIKNRYISMLENSFEIILKEN